MFVVYRVFCGANTSNLRIKFPSTLYKLKMRESEEHTRKQQKQAWLQVLVALVK